MDGRGGAWVDGCVGGWVDGWIGTWMMDGQVWGGKQDGDCGGQNGMVVSRVSTGRGM